MASAIRASAPYAPHCHAGTPAPCRPPAFCVSPGPLLTELLRRSDPGALSSVHIWDRHGLTRLAPPPASPPGRGCGACKRVRGEGVHRRLRVHESPLRRGRGLGDSIANFREPLLCLGPLARGAPRLTFPGRTASRPQARPAARFRPSLPPAFGGRRAPRRRISWRMAGSARPSSPSRLLSSVHPCPSAFSLVRHHLGLSRSAPRLSDCISLFLFFLPVSFHPFSPNIGLAVSPVCFFFPCSFLTVSLSLLPFFLFLPFCLTGSLLSLSLCFSASNVIFLFIFSLPHFSSSSSTPSVSCSPGNFTNTSGASSLIISNASRRLLHPPHSSELWSKPWKMSCWSGGVTGFLCSPAGPGCFGLVFALKTRCIGILGEFTVLILGVAFGAGWKVVGGLARRSQKPAGRGRILSRFSKFGLSEKTVAPAWRCGSP